ncbi:MAG: hypothetical protein WBP37_05445 [Candidatus Dechloromonas phosphoritropha]|jgi:hypothetical protein
MKTDTPQTIYLKDYTAPALLIDTVDLDIETGGTTVSVMLVLRRNLARPGADTGARQRRTGNPECCGRRRKRAIFRNAEHADHRRRSRCLPRSPSFQGANAGRSGDG